MDIIAVPRAPHRPPPTPTPDDRVASEEGGRPRILIVEDEYLVASELEAGLSEAGFAVIGAASTAGEAIRLTKAERPALIVMDIRLPGRRDGIEAAKEIFATTGIRCIFVTAYADTRTQERAQSAAPLGWIAKPYATEAVIAAVRDALGRMKQ